MKILRTLCLGSGAALVAVATVLVVANVVGQGMSSASEPILGLRVDRAFWLMALLCGVVGWYCLLGEKALLQCGLVTWLSVNFFVYVAGLIWMREMNLTTLIQTGGVAEAFNISAGSWALTAQGVFGCLLVCGIAGLFLSRRKRPDQIPAAEQ